MERLNRFSSQLWNDLKLWVFCVAFLQLNRILFIFVFRDAINRASGWIDIFTAILNGFRYDIMVAGYFIMIPVLAGALAAAFGWNRFASRVRMADGVIFIVTSAVLCVVSFGYFTEFRNVFDGFIFNIYYDDTMAIFTTMGSEYHLIPYLIMMGVVASLGVFLLRRFLAFGGMPSSSPAAFVSRPSRGIISVTLVIPFLFLTTGSFGSHPPKRSDAAITTDDFLNKTILNPYMALHYAIKEHHLLSGSDGLLEFLPGGDIASAVREVFPGAGNCTDLDSCMVRHAGGPKGEPPRHLFIVIEESYDSWPLLDKYASLGLTTRLKDIASRGLFVRNFLPASDGTMISLAAIMTGLPDAGVYTNYQRSAQKPFPSSPAEIFKRLGYRTRLFYSGYLSWQRIDDFTRAQGFEEVYGAPHIARWISTNQWGVDDESLFDFVTRHVPDDIPSFNIVLTTMFHPPYSIDVRAKGFPLREVPPNIKPVWGNTVNLNILGHLWYADRCLGNFVSVMERQSPDALFAITGDHMGRKFINSRPDFFERSSVPLVLYGPRALRGISLPEGAAGSHLDIVPTFIEMTAPKGFAYSALGGDLLAPRVRFLGIGRGRVISGDFLFDAEETLKFYPVPGKPLPSVLPDPRRMKRLHDALHGIAWWRITRGSLPDMNWNVPEKAASRR